jgi:hypothetical protein
MGKRNPWMAGLLSAILPGLGQFYNRQVGKGVGFLLGFLILAGFLIGGVDLKELDQAMATGTTPEGLWKLLALELLLLALFIWSIADAARVAKKV